jgi:hypothetical protein
MTNDHPSVLAASLAGIAVVAVGLVGLGFELTALGLGTCGGDGGLAYSPPASPQGQLCSVMDAGGYTALAVGEFVAVFAAVVLIAAWALGHIRGGRVAAVAVTAVFFPIVSFFALSAPADHCSDVDTAKYDTWQSKDPVVRPADAPNECGP